MKTQSKKELTKILVFSQIGMGYISWRRESQTQLEGSETNFVGMTSEMLLFADVKSERRTETETAYWPVCFDLTAVTGRAACDSQQWTVCF